MGIKKTTKNIVGAGVTLGVGNMILGSMGQAPISGKMMGPLVNVAYAKETLDIFTKKKRRK